jgi:periplasmic protein TonB
MFGTSQSDLVEEDAVFQPSVSIPVMDRNPAFAAPSRSEYGARRTNWPLILFILAGHAALLCALIMLDVIPVHKKKPLLTVVTMIELQQTPPPEPKEESKPVEQVKPQVTTPVQIVQAPIVTTTPIPAVVHAAPPPPPVPAAPAAPMGPVSVSDLGAKMISMVPPSYPVECRRRKEQGTVFLTVVLAIDGTVSEVHIARSSGSERLDKAALQAVRKWRWSPTIRNGAPVMVQGTVDIPFILKV